VLLGLTLIKAVRSMLVKFSPAVAAAAAVLARESIK